MAGNASPATSTQALTPDPAWLAAKNAFRVRSGVRPNQPKGTASHPFILAQTQLPCCGGGPHTVDQTTMWNAIYDIPPTPVQGDPTQGDGGYIW